MTEQPVRGFWKDDTVQQQFCDLISKGRTEYEAFETMREKYHDVDGTIVTFRQYSNYKRRDHDFARAIAGAMQQGSITIERSLIEDLNEEGTAKEKLSYLNLIENRIKRIESTATRHEEHDDVIATNTDDMLSVSSAARRRAIDAIEIKELDGND